MRKVVNITSIAGTDGNPGQVGYSSGKAGVIGLTKTLAKEWGRYNVNVNAVGFGLIETRLVQDLNAPGAGIEMHGHHIRLGVQPSLLESVKTACPLGPPRHAGRGCRRGPVLLLAAIGLRHRRSADLRRRPALLAQCPVDWRFAGVRFGIGVFREHVVFFHQPVNLQPVIEAMFGSGIVRVRMWLFLHAGDDFQNCRHTRLQGSALPDLRSERR